MSPSLKRPSNPLRPQAASRQISAPAPKSKPSTPHNTAGSCKKQRPPLGQHTTAPSSTAAPINPVFETLNPSAQKSLRDYLTRHTFIPNEQSKDVLISLALTAASSVILAPVVGALLMPTMQALTTGAVIAAQGPLVGLGLIVVPLVSLAICCAFLAPKILKTLPAAWAAIREQTQGPGFSTRALKMAATAPALAMGLGIAPLVAAGSIVFFSAPTAVSLLAALALNIYATQRDPLQSPASSISALGNLLAASICISGPGWLRLTGLAPAQVIFPTLIAAFSMMAAGHLVELCLDLIKGSAPTPLADHLQVPDYEIAATAFEDIALHKASPSVFNTPQDLVTVVKELQDLIKNGPTPFAGIKGMPVLPLYGPPGTGKSISAAAIAQATDGSLLSTSATKLDDATLKPIPVVFLRLGRLLLEAQSRGLRLGKMQWVFVDEFDDLMPKLDAPISHGRYHYMLGYVWLTRLMMSLARGRCCTGLIFATNHIDRVDPLIRLMTRRPAIYVGPMAQQSMEKLVQAKLVQIREELVTTWHIDCESLLRPAQITKLAELLLERSASGRDLRSPAEVVIGKVWLACLASGAIGHAQVRANPQEVADSVWAGLMAEVGSQTKSAAPPHHLAGSQRDSMHSEHSALAPSLEQEVDMDEVLRRGGLHHQQPFEAAIDLMHKLIGPYISNPEMHLKLNLLGLEAGGLMLRMSLINNEQTQSFTGERDIHDVPLSNDTSILPHDAVQNEDSGIRGTVKMIRMLLRKLERAPNTKKPTSSGG